ncbi:MAG: hypothetical protein U9Q68_04295 [Euryarchaeota archaeon]|nr:hypothetical protein [Euryarchaeota archaeon]
MNADAEEEYQYNDEKTILTVSNGDRSLTMYLYYEGIKTAKESGKPILFDNNVVNSFTYHHDKLNKIVNEEFIYISSVPKGLTGRSEYEKAILACIYDIGYNIYFNMIHNKNQYCHFLVLDSNGREITRIVSSSDKQRLIQTDSGGNEIASFNRSAAPTEEFNEKYGNFILETLEYSKTKKGKIQRLPHEKGLTSIKDISKTDDYLNFFTIS